MPRAKLVELFSRLIKVKEGTDQIYFNGEDNNYPERISRVINNSVTAKLASEKMCDFIVGRGLSNHNEVVFGRKKLYKTVMGIGRNISRQKSFALHINYDIEGVPNFLDSVPAKKVRLSKEDDLKNKGKIWVCDDWSAANENFFDTSNANKRKFFYPYNRNKDVILAQRNKDFNEYLKKNKIKESSLSETEILELKIKLYRGQILFVNLEEDEVYPNAWIDPAYNDADTQYRIGVYRNDNVRNGFRGATIVTVAEDAEGDESLVSDNDIKRLLGYENASNILVVSARIGNDGKIEDVINVDQVKSEVDTNQFMYDEQRVEENILYCFKNIPKILVTNSDSSLFGTSGEALKVAQDIYNAETQSIRDSINETLAEVLRETIYEGVTIVPLIDTENINESENELADSDSNDENEIEEVEELQ